MTSAKTAKPGEEETVYEKKYGFVRRSVPTDEAILHVLFPLEVYWRNVSIKQKIGEKIVNREGQIYPSFSDVVFPADYKIEMVDTENRNKFLIHQARGYVPCPICGKSIVARLENYEQTTGSKVRRFTPEVAYEIVTSALSKELSARVKSHIQYTHNYTFKKLHDETVMIVRFTGNQYVTFDAKIAVFQCDKDREAGIMGVYGILDHIVTHHEHVDKAREVLEYLGKLAETTKKIFGLGKENIPILGAYRSTFKYTLAERGYGDDEVRVLNQTWFKPWLRGEVIEKRGKVDMMFYMSIPRPLRMIYHYPLFRYVPHALAYKINPKQYIWFMESTAERLKKRGYPTKNVDAMLELVSGAFAYSKLEPRNAFEVDLKTLENLREVIDRVGTTARIFLERSS